MTASIYSELKRRNIFKVAAAYIVLAWLVVQITELMVSVISLPHWINLVVISIGLIGFPIILIAAWCYELTPRWDQTFL